MGDEKDFFEKLDEERAALDPRYAEMLRRDRFVLDLLPIRKSLQLTQEEVADRMGMKREVVGKIEATPYKVSMDKIFAYAVALGAEIVVKPPKEAA